MNDAVVLEQARQAALEWGTMAPPRLLRNRENAVFALDLPQGRAALRLHRQGYRTAAAIHSELWWCEALAARGAPVPRALRSRSGALTVALDGGRLASVVDWVDGEILGEAGKPLAGAAAEQTTLYQRLGALVAMVHGLTDGLALPADFERPRWDEADLLGEAPLWGRFWEHPLLTEDEARILNKTRSFCREKLTAYAASGADTGLIHADVLRENVLVEADTMTLIDFDDSGFGFRLYDLGTVLSQNLHEPNRAAITAALLGGYARARALRPADVEMVAVFTLLRCLASLGWTMGRLPPDDPRHQQYLDRALFAAGELRRGS